jgi:NADH-quinone oxidoreductase subunit N
MEFFLSLSTLLPEIGLALAAMALLLTGTFAGDRSTRSILDMSVVVLLITACTIISAQWGLGAQERMLSPGNFTDSSAFTSILKIIVLFGAAASLLMSYGFISREEMHRIEFPVLVLFATLGMMLMLSASNLLTLYIGIELMSLSLYVLAAFRRDATRATEAGLKYFVLGALASGILLYGISLIYGFTGTLDFDTIRQTLATTGTNAGVTTGIAFILVALAFKVSAAPFHMWTPDVYEGAPTPVTAFFSAVPKLAAMGLLIKVLYGPFAPLVTQWQPVMAALAVASMIVGALGAIGQNNIKRLLAYSSIGHVGFALMGLAAGQPDIVITYLVFYALMSLGAFAVVLLMRRDERMLEEIEDLSGISRLHPGLAACMAVLMFSMAGIPPLVGFFTKLYVFIAAVQADMVWLAVVGALASVVGAYYYLRIIKVMYVDEPVLGFDRSREVSLTGMLGVMTILTAIGLLLLSPVAMLAQLAIQSLLMP